MENVQPTYTKIQEDTAIIIDGCIEINGLIKVIKVISILQYNWIYVLLTYLNKINNNIFIFDLIFFK